VTSTRVGYPFDAGPRGGGAARVRLAVLALVLAGPAPAAQPGS